MRWGWPPQSRAVRWGVANLKYALILFAFELIILVLRVPGSGVVQALAISAGVLALILFAVGAFGWVRQKLLWRLRNRLIVTYVFVGVIPAILLLAMTGIATYLFSGQFANVVVSQELNTELKNMESVNATVAQGLARDFRSKNAVPPAPLEGMATAKTPSAPKEICAWLDGKPVQLTAKKSNCSFDNPANLPDQFGQVVVDQGALSMRAGSTFSTGAGKLRVVTMSPVNGELMGRISGELGTVGIYALAGTRPGIGPVKAEHDSGKTKLPVAKQPGMKVTNNGDGFEIEGSLQEVVSAGTLPEPVNFLDFETRYGAPLVVMAWKSGKPDNRFILGGLSRPSLLYGRLFSALGEYAKLAEAGLAAVAFLFAFIVLLALIIGSRLTRTITRSVANLYTATQHMNRGEFAYRIEVRERDQLATLQTSFNSMAASLQKLMLEQREKQRLENELTIAHEVQEQLFPRRFSQLASLEVHGFCKPARTVSGDYYDFLPATANRLGLAVGDVSGKGISAALLMATIHSAVRAYLLESVPAQIPVLAGGNFGDVGNGFPHGAGISPSMLMYLLNRQLYSTTPAEKYATLFLGLYDGSTRRLTYTNAGHLPPILLGTNGSIRRLETGGTVVGLFDNMMYEEGTVSLSKGEIFLAYSDGVTEPENDYGEFGEERLIELVRENRHLPLERINEIVTGAVYEWIGMNEQPDDVTLVLARAR